MNEAAKNLLLIDGNSVAFRAFYGLYNKVDHFVNHEGLHTNAIYSFKIMLDKLLKEIEPTNVLVAFDAGKKTFRTKMYSDYKGGRAKTPQELSEQFPYIRELLADYGIKSYDLKDYEADDIIGTLAHEAEEKDFKTTIVTGDRDLTQLVTDQTTVEITKKGVSELEQYTPSYVKEKLGINPDQIIDMKGLVGDSSDNYPGVQKIGEKTAVKLLKKYGSIEGIYDHIDEMRQSKMKEHLIEDKDKAFLSKDLAQIRKDAPLKVTLADTKWTGINDEELRSFFRKMNFNRFLSEMNKSVESKDEVAGIKEIKFTTLTANNIDEVPEIDGNASLGFYLEINGDNYHTAEIVGFAFEINDQYFASSEVKLLQEQPLKNILENPMLKLDVFNAKRTYVGLNRLGITMTDADFDLLLVSYLLNNIENSNDVGQIAHEHQYFDVQTDEEVYGKGAKRAIPSDQHIFLDHLTHKVLAIKDLKAKLMAKLKEHEQVTLYETMERPLSIVLAQMEISGIKVDIERLKEMKSEFKERLSEIEQRIYQEAGENFNISSPKQLGKVLFEKLKLPVIKKTKTGYSTAVSVLEQLRGLSPIIDNILMYRQLSKLQSTYVEGLLKVVLDDGKVHTRYTQTLTATGRLSSVDPNLQNIPVRLEEGRKIRQAFVPSHQGWQIFSSDYSQIELRVLAHISGDQNMQEAFKTGADIHANTAMKVFGLSDPSQVTPNMRRQAKAVNFGIVYGISDYGLAQNIQVSRKKAKQFIEAYFKSFPGVHKYMTGIVELAKKQGYVETLFHRRRYLPDINSKNYNLRSFAERTAMNSPIQGSAADIIKIAMINMQQMLKERNLKAKMLLQVHDELIFEAPKEEIPILEKVVPQVMDAAVKLAVPLKVESAAGNTWFDAKD